MARRGPKPIGGTAMHHSLYTAVPFALWVAIKADAERHNRSVAASVRHHLWAALMAGECPG